MRLVFMVLAVLAAACVGSAAPPVHEGLAWQTLAAAPSARTEVSATVLGTKIYVAGGFRADGSTVATVEVFDTSTRTWTAGPDLLVPVNHAMAATVSAAVYVFGGYDSAGNAFAGGFRLTDSGWQSVANLPEPRAAGTAAVVNGRVYIAGGIGQGGVLASQMLVYDAAANTWSTAPGPPTPREHLGGAGFGNRVYTVGGRTGAGNLDAFEVFDVGTREWSSLPALPTPRGGMSATATCTGKVIGVGGEAQATFSEAEIYEPTSNAWRSLPPLPTPRHGLGVVTVGPVLYVIAGGPKPGLHVADTNEALDLSRYEACP